MPEHPELPPIAAEPLSVVLPAWNEDSTLAEVIQAWVTYLDSLGRDYELLVVDEHLEPFAELKPLPAEILNGADAVQPQPTLGVGVVEIGIEGRRRHRSV